MLKSGVPVGDGYQLAEVWGEEEMKAFIDAKVHDTHPDNLILLCLYDPNDEEYNKLMCTQISNDADLLNEIWLQQKQPELTIEEKIYLIVFSLLCAVFA